MHTGYKPYIAGLCALLVCVSPALAASGQDRLAHMSIAQRHAAQKYFRAHAFGFSQNYGLYHPGPYWILHHLAPFHLTAAQKHQEMMLKLGMARTTVEDNHELKVAYARYQADSIVLHPNVGHIHADIRRIGHIQTALAFEMIPFHQRSYALLNPKQREVYRQLVQIRVQKKKATTETQP